MSRLNRFLLVTALGAIICIITAYVRAESDSMTENPEALSGAVVEQIIDGQHQASHIVACRAAENGKWLSEYNECEYMPTQTCNELGGEMNECASACRHHPEAEVCISLCVPVCKFEL